MDYRLVESYEVAVLTGFATIRQIVIVVRRPDEDPRSGATVVLNFQESVPVPDVVGSSQYNLPLRDFNDIYHILQTEKPVYFQDWQDQHLIHLRIGTFNEPLGEGFEDTSN